MKTALEGEDIEDIKAKKEELEKVVQELSAKVYEQLLKHNNKLKVKAQMLLMTVMLKMQNSKKLKMTKITKNNINL